MCSSVLPQRGTFDPLLLNPPKQLWIAPHILQDKQCYTFFFCPQKFLDNEDFHRFKVLPQEVIVLLATLNNGGRAFLCKEPLDCLLISYLLSPHNFYPDAAVEVR